MSSVVPICEVTTDDAAWLRQYDRWFWDFDDQTPAPLTTITTLTARVATYEEALASARFLTCEEARRILGGCDEDAPAPDISGELILVCRLAR